MVIRPATAEDVPSVLPMVAAACAFHERLEPAKYGFEPQPEQMYRNWLVGRTRDARSVFLVAERDGRLIGFLVATIERDLSIYRVKEYGFIHDVWVEPPYRNEGIGRQLVMLAVERFAKLGVRQVRLDTLITNHAARGLFERCGFRAATMQMLMELNAREG